MEEFLEHPAVFRIASIEMPFLAAAVEATCLVEYPLKTSVFTFASLRVCLTHLLMVCVDATWCGFLVETNSNGQSALRNLSAIFM